MHLQKLQQGRRLQELIDRSIRGSAAGASTVTSSNRPVGARGRGISHYLTYYEIGSVNQSEVLLYGFGVFSESDIPSNEGLGLLEERATKGLWSEEEPATDLELRGTQGLYGSRA